MIFQFVKNGVHNFIISIEYFRFHLLIHLYSYFRQLITKLITQYTIRFQLLMREAAVFVFKSVRLYSGIILVRVALMVTPLRMSLLLS